MPQINLTCAKCGYYCDQTMCPDEPGAVAQIGDLGMCINCGQIHVLGAGGWAQMSDKEIAQLGSAERSYLQQFELARRATATEDLAIKQKLDS